ncbi:MAG: hypothetical protein Q7J77_01870 [Undibacterium sp.]|nr:hypothetical protein [Undibacterium sp.]
MAIPLQGLAAASMMLCATEHHHQISTGQAPQASAHQHHAGDEMNDANAVHTPSSDQTTVHHQVTKDKCSSCAACCIGAAMVSTPLDSPVSRPPSEKIDMVFSSHFGHISDSPERPPRA